MKIIPIEKRKNIVRERSQDISPKRIRRRRTTLKGDLVKEIRERREARESGVTLLCLEERNSWLCHMLKGPGP